jgi:primosomal protein N' (replication factor Y)
MVKGYVLALTDRAELSEQMIKEIAALDEKQMDMESQFIALAGWMKNRYASTMNQAMKTVMPVKAKVVHVVRTYIRAVCAQDELQRQIEICRHKGYKAKERLLSALSESDVLEQSIARNKLNITKSTVDSLVKQGIIVLEQETALRNPIKNMHQRYEDVQLNEQQNQAVSRIWQDYESGQRHTWLLQGITGSGKTEVYLELIGRMLEEKRQVIVLIPEISLTYQTVMRFYRRFGDRVSIVNSRMSAGERYDQFLRAKNGDVDIMIGPRSALFTPFSNLGLVVIDEEHEDSYKSEGAPRYDAREVAIHRCEMTGGMVLLGSATPSIESRYLADRGVYCLAKLTKRGNARAVLPKVEIVDLRRELQEGNRSILSRSLHDKIEKCLLKHEQVMLFLNRRGYSNFISCRSCGEALMCPNCDISLTLHQDGSLRCHYCGYVRKADQTCPSCGSRFLAGLGIGTQKAASLVQREFPDARILRMDMDTTSKKGSHEQILETFANEEADILLGTQMIVKGHDFQNVTLVGILVADKSLYASTYRASEKTFQLLTQAAGRAGRGALPGDVVIQTYRPEHFVIRASAAQDYEGFYERELRYRAQLGYPPIRCMLSVLVTAPVEADAARAARDIATSVAAPEVGRDLKINGPTQDTIGRINNLYRQVIFIHSDDINKLISIQNDIEKMINVDKYPEVVVNLDLS